MPQADDWLAQFLAAERLPAAYARTIEFDRIDRIRGRFGPAGLTDYAPA